MPQLVGGMEDVGERNSATRGGYSFSLKMSYLLVSCRAGFGGGGERRVEWIGEEGRLKSRGGGVGKWG